MDFGFRDGSNFGFSFEKVVFKEDKSNCSSEKDRDKSNREDLIHIFFEIFQVISMMMRNGPRGRGEGGVLYVSPCCVFRSHCFFTLQCKNQRMEWKQLKTSLIFYPGKSSEAGCIKHRVQVQRHQAQQSQGNTSGLKPDEKLVGPKYKQERCPQISRNPAQKNQIENPSPPRPHSVVQIYFLKIY